MAIDFNPTSSSESRRNIAISGVVFLCAFGFALAPDVFDRPATRLVFGFVNHSWLLDHLAEASNKYFSFSGIILLSLIWCCWFESSDPERRVRLLLGTLASIGAGGISRFLQHRLPSHPRPYFDEALGSQPPTNLELAYNYWNSFPSDHVTVFAALVVVLFIVRSRFATYAIVWMMIVESFRNYIGAHYPSDIIAGAALGAFAVWASQLPWPIAVGRKIMRWEKTSPGIFYMGAFFFSYQIATLFDDIRQTLGPIRDHLLNH